MHRWDEVWSRVGWHVWTSRRATSWVTWAREGMWTRQEMGERE